MHEIAGAISVAPLVVGRSTGSVWGYIQNESRLMDLQSVAEIELDFHVVDVRGALPAIAQRLEIARYCPARTPAAGRAETALTPGFRPPFRPAHKLAPHPQ